LAVAGLGYFTLRSDPAAKSDAIVVSDLDDIDDDAKGDCITAEEVAQIFDRLFRECQGIFAQLMQNIQMIRMQGQNIPEAQVMGLVQKEMVNALTVKQAQALEEFEMDYDCFEQATWEFLEKEDKYPQVVKAVNRFQKFWSNISGQDDLEGWRPGKVSAPVELLTPEKTIEVAQVYFDSLTEQMRELVSQYKADGKNLQSPAVQNQLNLDFSEKAQASGEGALEGVGVTMKQFEASVKAHSGNPTVNRTIQQIQMKQQQDLMSIGAANS